MIKDDGLGNCYNFVKDIVLSLSEDVSLGVETLSKIPVDHVEDLTEMLLTLFYDSYTETDPYHKKTIKFGILLAKKISQQLQQGLNLKN